MRETSDLQVGFVIAFLFTGTNEGIHMLEVVAMVMPHVNLGLNASLGVKGWLTNG